MKKFIIIFILLILGGGTVFFFGWVNLFVPAGSYGVMVSKTSGFDDTLLGPDSGFVWRWQNLIPTNLTIHIFDLKEQRFNLTSKGSLPQAEILSELSPLKPSFNYEINLSVYYKLRPQALVRLVQTEGLTPDNISSFYAKKQEVITAVLLRQLALTLENPEELSGAEPLRLASQLLARVRDQFTELELTSISLNGPLNLPAPEVYVAAKNAYLNLLAEKNRLGQEKLRLAATLYQKDDIAFERSLKQLEQYGELLNRYPVLLKYLFITSDKNADLILPEIKELFKTQ